MKRLLEVVISTKEEAIIAEAAGADRLEISINHQRRGTTQDVHDISGIISVVSIPSYVLIRPNPFTYEYSDEEFNRVLHVIEICKISNIKGVTIGFLKNGKIDREKLDYILKIKGELEINFSRAIDSVVDYEEEIKYLESLESISAIHTSGAAETVIDGYVRLRNILGKSKKIIFSGALNVEGITKLDQCGVKTKIYQVNSGVRINYDYNNLISFDMIKEIKEELDK